jgi:hypothetical protein
MPTHSESDDARDRTRTRSEIYARELAFAALLAKGLGDIVPLEIPATTAGRGEIGAIVYALDTEGFGYRVWVECLTIE